MKNWALFAAILFLITLPAYSISGRAVVPSSSLKSSNVTITEGGKKKRKIVFCLSRTPGDAKAVSGGMRFTSYSHTIAALKARRVHGGKLTTYTLLKKAGTSVCKKLSGSPSPTPTPTPQNPNLGNFDLNGNVTNAGKIAFGIPSSLSGNITQGRTLYTSYCTGCHVERTGRSFTNLRTSIAQSPMLFDSTQVTDGMLANITAFLNRFKL